MGLLIPEGKVSLNILHIAAELSGWAQQGGAGEVPVNLAWAQLQQGHDARLMVPFYACLWRHLNQAPNLVWEGKLPGSLPPARVFEFGYPIRSGHLRLYLVEGHSQFQAANTSSGIYAPEEEPGAYQFFAATVTEFLRQSEWTVDIIHGHDYHAGLVPVYLHTVYGGQIAGRPVGTVFTGHNLLHQGRASAEWLAYGGLSEQLAEYSAYIPNMEFAGGGINCLKGALEFSDVTTVVSPTYAKEIQMPQYGCGLDGVLAALQRRGRLQGILNGIDTAFWDPQKLPEELAFTPDNLAGKAYAKQMLRKQYGLNAESPDPLLLVQSRWGYQKGQALLVESILRHDLHRRAQVLVVTWGETPQDEYYYRLWFLLRGLACSYPERIAVQPNGVPLADRGMHYAGADVLVMPSIFEPCGLGQLEAMRYGCLPLVRRTGGLADTVPEDVGFVFDWDIPPLDTAQQREEGYRDGAPQLMKACDTMLVHYTQQSTWEERIRKAMRLDHDWRHRVPAFEEAYWAARRRAFARLLLRIGLTLSRPGWQQDPSGQTHRLEAGLLRAFSAEVDNADLQEEVVALSESLA